MRDLGIKYTMKKYTITAIVAILALGLGASFVFFSGSNETSEERTAKIISQDQPVGGDFTIQTFDGDVSLSDFKGQLVLLYFGYTFCPDICPTNLANLSMAYRQLSAEEQAKVQVILISVDPIRDTPERLKQYGEFFKMNMLSGTSDKENLLNIAKNYGVVFVSHQESPEDMYYAVDHSAFTYLIDKQGNLITQLPHATTPDEFINAIKNNL